MNDIAFTVVIPVIGLTLVSIAMLMMRSENAVVWALGFRLSAVGAALIMIPICLYAMVLGASHR